jgi:pectate lyase C
MSRNPFAFLLAALVLLAGSLASAATIQVSTTIRVTSGTFDGQNNTYVSNGLGDGSQDEGQSPIFRCENGATIQNVIIGAPAADGIHFYNGCTLRNVRWTDVGEDASTVKSAGNVTIDGGFANIAADKVMQVNAATKYVIRNFSANDFGTFLRQNGGTGFTITVCAENITLSNGDRGFRTDSSSSQFYWRNINWGNISDAEDRFTVPNQSQVHGWDTSVCGGSGGGGGTPTEFTLVNVNSNKCLDVNGRSTADGARVIQWTCNGQTNQRWRSEDAGSGYVRLRAVHSNKCMDVAGVSTADGALIQQWTCGSGQNQQFLLQDQGGGQYRITPRHSGKAVDVQNCSTADGAQVRQWTWLNNNCQRFRRQ